jgi:hypothetical protein
MKDNDIWKIYIGFEKGIEYINIKGLILWMNNFMRFIFYVLFIKKYEFKIIVKKNEVMWGIKLKSYFELK